MLTIIFIHFIGECLCIIKLSIIRCYNITTKQTVGTRKITIITIFKTNNNGKTFKYIFKGRGNRSLTLNCVIKTSESTRV